MDTLILNIGLNIGRTSSTIDCKEVLQYIKNMGTNIFDYSIKEGEYCGIKEKTLIIEVSNLSKKQIANISKEFLQECIAVYNKKTNSGELVYVPEFKGEKIKFDINYFNF